MKLKKNIPLIDQHDKLGFWGGKFGGSYIPETLKKPVEDLTIEFNKLRKNKKFLKKKNFYFKNYIGSPTSFTKLENEGFSKIVSNLALIIFEPIWSFFDQEGTKPQRIILVFFTPSFIITGEKFVGAIL